MASTSNIVSYAGYNRSNDHAKGSHPTSNSIECVYQSQTSKKNSTLVKNLAYRQQGLTN